MCVIAFVFSLSQHRRRSSFKSVIDTARTRMKNALDTLNNNLLACRHFFLFLFFSTLPFSFASLTFSLPFSRYLALFLSFFCSIHGEPVISLCRICFCSLIVVSLFRFLSLTSFKITFIWRFLLKLSSRIII